MPSPPPPSEEEQRIAYCRSHELQHLFELLVTKVLVDRPENPFGYLRELLTAVEETEMKKGSYDPTQIHFADDDGNSTGDAAAAGSNNGAVLNGSGIGGTATTTTTEATTTTTTTTTTVTTADSPRKRRKITLGTFGLNNAGKTTLLSALGGNVDPNCMPTVGFTPIRFSTDDFDICIFDLGGAANFRGIWVHYFHDCHGLLYVVDSAGDAANLAESLEVFVETAGHPLMRGKPVLVLANKKDLPNSRVHGTKNSKEGEDTTATNGDGERVMPEDVIAAAVPFGTPFREIATCGLRGGDDDPTLDAGVEWLLATVADKYSEVAARVAEDTAHVKAEKERQRQERLAALRAE